VATPEKPLSPFFLRLTHTGVHKDGSPNLSSVPLYDLQVGFEYQTRKQTVYVPVGGYVDLPVAPRVLLALSAGTIGLLIRDGLLNLDIIARFRDISDFGGAGTGVSLAPTVPNAERTGNVLSFVIEAGPDMEGFVAGEEMAVAGLTGAFGGLNGSYTIDTVAVGQGLVGADPDLYLITVTSEGPDIAGAGLAGVNLTLPDGKVNVELHSTGGLAGLGDNLHSYVAGDAIVTHCMKAGALTLLHPDNGSSICPNSFFWESTSGEPYWKDAGGVLRPILGATGTRAYQFSAGISVPSALGVLYLRTGDVPTSSAPLSVDRSATLAGAAITVDRPDGTRDYQLEVLVNGVIQETLVLVSGSTKVATYAFSSSLSVLDEISLRLVRSSGSGKSTFQNAIVTLITETPTFGRAYQFSACFAVPSARGVLYLRTGDVPTSSAPITVDRAATLTGAAVTVDVADGTRTYELQVLVNGTVRETLVLASGFIKAATTGFSYSVTALDEISLRLVRSSGSGKSTFQNAVATLTVSEV
jgi:hypothetical protein